VLARAMTRKPEPIEWDETMTAAAAVPEEATELTIATQVPRRLSLLKISTRASLVIPGAHWAETTVPAMGEVLRRDRQ
jgi:hypothetical protein